MLPFSTWTCTIHLYRLHFACLPPPALWQVPDGQFWFCLATEQNPYTSPLDTASGMHAHMQNTQRVLFYILTHAKATIPSSFPTRTCHKSTALSTSSPAITWANIPAVLSVTVAAIYLCWCCNTKAKRDQPIPTPNKHACFLGKTYVLSIGS